MTAEELAAPAITSPREAEEFAAVWLREVVGEGRVMVTALAGDAGLDVVSERFAVQVKRYAKTVPVGRPDIQRLVGATPAHLTPLFLTSGRYTPSAIEYAKDRGVALFRHKHGGGRWPSPHNVHAHRVAARKKPSSRAAPTNADVTPFTLAKVIRRRVAGAERLDPRVIAAIIREADRIRKG